MILILKSTWNFFVPNELVLFFGNQTNLSFTLSVPELPAHLVFDRYFAPESPASWYKLNWTKALRSTDDESNTTSEPQILNLKAASFSLLMK